jgi:hypothetical protein
MESNKNESEKMVKNQKEIIHGIHCCYYGAGAVCRVQGLLPNMGIYLMIA